MDELLAVLAVTAGQPPGGDAARCHGVHSAVVVDVVDPDGQGRVRIRLPWAPDADGDGYEAWARLATLMAGAGHGTWFVPDVGDEVLIAFAGADPRHPVVLGGLWNGQDAPPERMDGAGSNERKTIRTRNGVELTFVDAPGQEQLSLRTPGGQTVVLEDGPGTVTAADANGNSVKLETSGITVTAAATVTVSASSVDVSAGMVSVNAGMSRFSGVVQADTVITNSVVSASYTPGAGNIW